MLRQTRNTNTCHNQEGECEAVLTGAGKLTLWRLLAIEAPLETRADVELCVETGGDDSMAYTHDQKRRCYEKGQPTPREPPREVPDAPERHQGAGLPARLLKESP